MLRDKLRKVFDECNPESLLAYTYNGSTLIFYVKMPGIVWVSASKEYLGAYPHGKEVHIVNREITKLPEIQPVAVMVDASSTYLDYQAWRDDESLREYLVQCLIGELHEGVQRMEDLDMEPTERILDEFLEFEFAPGVE